jgi:hypothetical protein
MDDHPTKVLKVLENKEQISVKFQQEQLSRKWPSFDIWDVLFAILAG